MWNSPPCRKPAVTRRQYSPWANPTFHLAPNRTKVRMSRFMTASPLPPRMLKITVAMYSPKLSSRMMVVLKRKWGMNPPTNWEESSPETRRGATASLQYGQTRSLVVMNARQCGHMRRGSISTIIRCRGQTGLTWDRKPGTDGTFSGFRRDRKPGTENREKDGTFSGFPRKKKRGTKNGKKAGLFSGSPGFAGKKNRKPSGLPPVGARRRS